MKRTVILLLLAAAPTFAETPAPEASRERFLARAFEGRTRALAGAVVHLEANGRRVGFGVVLGDAEEPQVLAVSHLVEDAAQVVARTGANERFVLEALGDDRVQGIALYRFRALADRRFAGVDLRGAPPVAVGRWALTSGDGPDPLAVGVIGAVDRHVDRMRRLPENLRDLRLHFLPAEAHSFTGVFQHDAPLSDDWLGSPVADAEGRVIGVNVYRVARGTAYALPAARIVAALVPLRARRDIRVPATGKLGLQVRSLTPAERAALREHGWPGGVFVAAVDPGGAGADAGVREGDVITALSLDGDDGTAAEPPAPPVPVFSSGQLVDRMRRLPPGRAIRLHVVRNHAVVPEIRPVVPAIPPAALAPFAAPARPTETPAAPAAPEAAPVEEN